MNTSLDNYNRRKSTISDGTIITNDSYGISDSKYTILKIIYVLSSCLITGIGIYILYKFKQILTAHHIFFIIYVTSYTFLWPITIVICLITALFVSIIKRLFFKTDNNNNNNREFFDKYKSSSYDFNNMNINMNIDDQSSEEKHSFQYLTVVFVFILVVLYTIGIPASFYMLYLMIDHHILSNYKTYSSIYSFVILILITSFVCVGIFVYYMIIEKFLSNKIKLDIDDDFINKVEEEVKRNKKLSGALNSNRNLPKPSDFLNRNNIMDFHLRSSIADSREGAINIIDEKNEENDSELNNKDNFKLSINEDNTHKKSSFTINDIENTNNLNISFRPNTNTIDDIRKSIDNRENKKYQIKSLIKKQTLNNDGNNIIKDLKSQLTYNKDFSFVKTPEIKRTSPRFNTVMERRPNSVYSVKKEIDFNNLSDDEIKKSKTDKDNFYEDYTDKYSHTDNNLQN
jgi:hypothetical protein